MVKFGSKIIAAIPIFFAVLFFVLPISLLVTQIFQTGGFWENIRETLFSNRTKRAFLGSLEQGIIGSLGSAIFGLPIAFLLYKLRFRGQNFLRFIYIAPFAAPTIAIGIAFRSLFAQGGLLDFLQLDGSFWAVAVALLFFNVGYFARQVGAKWNLINPNLELAAAVLGAGSFRIFLRIILPALRITIINAMLIIFIFCSSAYGIVMTLGGPEIRNLESEIYFQGVSLLKFGNAAVLAILQILFMLILIYLTYHLTKTSQNKFGNQNNVHFETHKQRRGFRSKDIPYLTFAIFFALIIIILPLWNLIWQALHPKIGSEISFGSFMELWSAKDPRISITLIDATLNSLKIAAISTILAISISIIIIKFIPKISNFFTLLLGVSSVALGFGMLLAVNKPFGLDFHFTNTAVLIPIAQSLIAIPIILRIVLPAIQGIDSKIIYSAQILGASKLKIFRKIELPIIALPLGIAAGTAFAMSLGEFGATSFLATENSNTLPTLIYRLMALPQSKYQSMGIAGALFLIFLTTGIMYLCEKSQRRENA